MIKEPAAAGNYTSDAERQTVLSLAANDLAGRPFDEQHAVGDDDALAVRSRDLETSEMSATASRWHIVQRVDDVDPLRASRQVAEDLAGGVTGFSLVFEGAPNAFGYGLPATTDALALVLADVPLNTTHIRIDVHPASRALAETLVDLLARRRADPARLSLSLGLDLAALLASTGRLRMSIEALQASMPQSLAHFFALGVPGVILEADGRVFHNAGASEAQELGVMLAIAVNHLRLFEDARQALVYAAPHIGFAISVDQDQFRSAAKIKALRRLWSRVQQDCSIPDVPTRIHAETSYRMLSSIDPETNIFRNTVAAFAAASGGADSISILPHTIAIGLPDAAARRMARGTQLVMAAESPMDLDAGTDAVETLTDALCTSAWKEFQSIEQEGGILKSLVGGSIQERIIAARDKRAVEYADGARSMFRMAGYDAPRPAILSAERRRPSTDGSVLCRPLETMRIEASLDVIQ